MGKPPTTTTRPQPTAVNRRRLGREIRPEAVLLLRMAQTGDRDAFAELYRAFADNVRRDALVPADGTRHTLLIAQALAELDPVERLTVQLRFLDGHQRRTTAQIMACSEWTVRQTQRRALAHLADRLSAPPAHEDTAAHPAG